jgi:hypothetical protein
MYCWHSRCLKTLVHCDASVQEGGGNVQYIPYNSQIDHVRPTRGRGGGRRGRRCEHGTWWAPTLAVCHFFDALKNALDGHGSEGAAPGHANVLAGGSGRRWSRKFAICFDSRGGRAFAPSLYPLWVRQPGSFALTWARARVRSPRQLSQPIIEIERHRQFSKTSREIIPQSGRRGLTRFKGRVRFPSGSVEASRQRFSGSGFVRVQPVERRLAARVPVTKAFGQSGRCRRE